MPEITDYKLRTKLISQYRDPILMVAFGYSYWFVLFYFLKHVPKMCKLVVVGLLVLGDACASSLLTLDDIVAVLYISLQHSVSLLCM